MKLQSMDERMILGTRFISGVVATLVSQIVETAIEVYALTPLEAKELRAAYCDRDLFTIVPS
jgi:hypothetical protein